MREFYILYNEYGMAFANGRKNKILVKTIPPPFTNYKNNFMDKEKMGIIVSNLSCPKVEPPTQEDHTNQHSERPH